MFPTIFTVCVGFLGSSSWSKITGSESMTILQLWKYIAYCFTAQQPFLKPCQIGPIIACSAPSPTASAWVSRVGLRAHTHTRTHLWAYHLALALRSTQAGPFSYLQVVVRITWYNSTVRHTAQRLAVSGCSGPTSRQATTSHVISGLLS